MSTGPYAHKIAITRRSPRADVSSVLRLLRGQIEVALGAMLAPSSRPT
jgi:hypothetical protein